MKDFISFFKMSILTLTVLYKYFVKRKKSWINSDWAFCKVTLPENLDKLAAMIGLVNKLYPKELGDMVILVSNCPGRYFAVYEPQENESSEQACERLEKTFNIPTVSGE